ncbi:MAG TPA: cyclase [Chloroflexi bacterium]|nr:cyclase [Chloroflexota bacterium]
MELISHIAAPAERCFDLSRDIGLHQQSMHSSKEIAVAGVTAGLIGPNEFVTWEARHFGIHWRMTSRITAFDRPRLFVDESNEGPFASFRHEHRFESRDITTTMRDIVDFRLPFGLIGRLADLLVATPYLRRLLRLRNLLIRSMAEGSSGAAGELG